MLYEAHFRYINEHVSCTGTGEKDVLIVKGHVVCSMQLPIGSNRELQSSPLFTLIIMMKINGNSNYLPFPSQHKDYCVCHSNLRQHARHSHIISHLTHTNILLHIRHTQPHYFTSRTHSYSNLHPTRTTTLFHIRHTQPHYSRFDTHRHNISYRTHHIIPHPTRSRSNVPLQPRVVASIICIICVKFIGKVKRCIQNTSLSLSTTRPHTHKHPNIHIKNVRVSTTFLR